MSEPVYIDATALRATTMECSPEVRFMRRGVFQVLQQKWLEHVYVGSRAVSVGVVWRDVPTVDETA